MFDIKNKIENDYWDGTEYLNLYGERTRTKKINRIVMFIRMR